ncbi:MAG: HU family DNA-binding protein [Armatimonadota bacterium]
MKKADLVDCVAAEVGLTKRQAGEAVEAVLAGITRALADGSKVSVAGFGTFLTRQRAARMGRNPQTKAPVHIPAVRVPVFRAGKGLKDAVK